LDSTIGASDDGMSDGDVLLTAVSRLTTSIFESLLQAVAANPKTMKMATAGERDFFTSSE